MSYIAKVLKTTLKSPLTPSSTSVILEAFLDSKSAELALADFGTWGVIVIKQGSAIEMLKFDGVTQNADGSATLDVMTSGRDIDPTTPYASYSSGQSFQTGAEVIVTNDPFTMSYFPRVDNVNTFSAVQTFASTAIPIYDTHPTFIDDKHFIDKKYADDLAIAGAPNASVTVKGISEEATEAEIDADTALGATLARLFINPSTLATSKYGVRLPTSGEKNALVGNNTDIAIGTGNKYVSQTGLQDGAEVYAVDSEASDAYVITLSPVPVALQAGQVIHFKANTANTGACTLNVNSLGAKSIVSRYDKELFDGDILANQIVTVAYNGTNFQMISNPSQLYELESASGNIQASADTERNTTSKTYVKLKEISVDDFGGIIHTIFRAKSSTGTYAFFARIYVNGSPVGTERTGLQTTYQTFTEDITVVKGDLVQLYAHHSVSSSGGITYVDNFRLGFNIIESIKTDVSGTTVITD